jgi:hypothetical protein
MDLTSQYNPTFNGDGGNVFLQDLSLGKGLAAFHASNRLSASGVWLLPFGAGRAVGTDWPRWLDAIVGGWQLGGILTLSDGNPSTVGMGTPAALTSIGFSGLRPDLIEGGNNNPVTGDPDKYFDVSQFVPPPPRTIGNLGRNTLILPGIATVDLGLTKNTPIRDRARLQLRIEFFNLLNRANFGGPALSVFNASGARQGNAGFIASTSTTARQIQLGARFEW